VIVPVDLFVVLVAEVALLALLSVTRLGSTNFPMRAPKKDDSSLKNGGFVGAGEMVCSGIGVWIRVSMQKSCSEGRVGESLMTERLLGNRREEKLLRRVGVSPTIDGVGATDIR
jgi:hypothetical protein